jgi:hypothetical protein
MQFSLETQGNWQDVEAAEELIREVENRYDLEVQRFAREGPIYVLQTSSGLKGLKKSGLSLPSLFSANRLSTLGPFSKRVARLMMDLRPFPPVPGCLSVVL